jgi:hydrogenase/urease accessory protein HupE
MSELQPLSLVVLAGQQTLSLAALAGQQLYNSYGHGNGIPHTDTNSKYHLCISFLTHKIHMTD